MASISQWVRKFKSNLNPMRMFNQLWYIDDIKGGKFIGQDQFGNKYYEDVNEVNGRHRHVEYASHDINASQVPPHWRQWLHSTFHEAPLPKCDETATYKWLTVKHVENPTGSEQAYKPYSTTKPKMYSWEPKTKERI